jgi:uncharacterized protein with HEPN domain
MKRDDIIRLRHILESANKIESYAKGYNRNDFNNNQMLVSALIRELVVIGEAASKVSVETRNDLKSIEWNKMIGMRNRLIHAYYDINLNIIWNTVQNVIPELIRELESITDLE